MTTQVTHAATFTIGVAPSGLSEAGKEFKLVDGSGAVIKQPSGWKKLMLFPDAKTALDAAEEMFGVGKVAPDGRPIVSAQRLEDRIELNFGSSTTGAAVAPAARFPSPLGQKAQRVPEGFPVDDQSVPSG